jgi:hypothetical protein
MYKLMSKAVLCSTSTALQIIACKLSADKHERLATGIDLCCDVQR